MQILNGLELEATLLRLLSLRVSHLDVRWRGRAMPSVFLWLIQLWLQASDLTKNLLRFRKELLHRSPDTNEASLV